MGAAVLYRVKPAAQPAIKSLAVLPLKNLSGDPDQEYLADAMTEEIIGRLSGIRDLRVISRTSIMRFKDTHLSVPEIARALNVDALVEGSVIRDGNRIRVHAQLIRSATDEHFWSEEYDRDLSDVPALQSNLAQAIAEKVEVTVTGQERARLVAARRVSPEVYESFLKGRNIRYNSKDDIQKSIAYFDEAIRKDPTRSSVSSTGACSVFTARYGPADSRSRLKATLYIRGSGSFVASATAPIATGWSEPVPGRGFQPAVDQRLSRRTDSFLFTSTVEARYG